MTTTTENDAQIKSNSKVSGVTAKAGKRSSKAIQEKEVKISKQLRKLENVSKEAATSKPVTPITRSVLDRKGKKYKDSYKLIDHKKTYQLEEAINLAKKTSKTKFDATIELHIGLNVDPKHADQNIRDNVVLPFGTGQKIRVAVFTDDEQSAKTAGADIIGNDKLLADIEKGKLDFDVLITSPALMPRLSKYARILGPRGLMPNPKSGSVATDIAKAIAETKSGKIEYRVDSYGIIHTRIGKVSFKDQDLINNFTTLITSIKNNKPQSVKSNYLKSIYITSSMGPSIKLDLQSIN